MAYFQIKVGSIVKINDQKVRMEVKFKSDDGSKLTANWQLWECESVDDEEIRQALQKAADDYEATPAIDSTPPVLTTGQWVQAS